MPYVVLAVTEGSLAVLPGLAPVNGRQPHEKRDLRERRREHRPAGKVEVRTPLEAMFPGGVVVDGRTIVDAAEGRQDRVTLGRVEVPTRRIGAEGPGRAAQSLPRGQREGTAEEGRER